MKTILLTVMMLCGIMSGLSCAGEKEKNGFDSLIAMKEKGSISDAELEECFNITKTLYDSNIDHVKSMDGEKETYYNLTHTFADLCMMAPKKSGIKYYLKYLDYTGGSAEEERSFSLERLFLKYPGDVLDAIGNNEDLLSSIAWGFVNNYIFEIEGEIEDETQSSDSEKIKTSSPELNQENYRELFMSRIPGINEIYKDHTSQLDFILEEISGII